MAPPTWSVGQVLTAADVNNWFVPLAAIKTTGQTVTSSTVLVNDTALVVAVAANASYVVECYLWYDGASPVGTGDLKVQWAAPSGASYAMQSLTYNAAGNDLERLTFTASVNPTQIFGTEGTGVNARGVSMKGSLSVASTSGNFQLQWAQNASNATATTVHSQSYLMLWRIS